MASPRSQIIIMIASFVVLLGIGVSGWVVSIFGDRPEPTEVTQEDPRLFLYGIVVDLNESVARADLDSAETIESVRQSFLSAISRLESIDSGDSAPLARRFDDLLITGFELSRDLVEAVDNVETAQVDTAAALGDVARIVGALEDALEGGDVPAGENPTLLEQLSPLDVTGLALVVLGIVVTIVIPLIIRRKLHTLAAGPVAPVAKPTAPTPHPERIDTDALSGAVGRSSFERSLVGEVARSKRYSHPLTVVVFRIDTLDDLYEQMGAATGDYILTTVGETVCSNIRVSDLFGRIGENTFVILLPETDIGGGRKVAEKLRRNVEIYPFDEVSRVTLSVGVTAVAQEDDGSTLLARAETASHRAAERGGNAVVAVQRSTSE